MKNKSKPKKSSQYFLFATILIIIGSSAMLLYKYSLSPLLGLFVIFLGMFIGKKGSQINNIELGRDKDFVDPKLKLRTQSLLIFSISFLLVACIAILYVLKS